MANGYTEVWNPPEAGAHARHAAVKAPAGKQAAKNVGKHAASVRNAKPGARLAQATKPHAQVVQTQSGQARAMHADIAQVHTAHGGAVALKGPKTEKSAAAKPAPVKPDPQTLSANAGADRADAAADPATARSGSLPPILH